MTPSPKQEHQSIDQQLGRHEAQIEGLIRAFEAQREVNQSLANRCGAIELNVATNLTGKTKGAEKAWGMVVVYVTLALTIIGLLIALLKK